MESREWHGDPSRLCIQRYFPIWIASIRVVVERPPLAPITTVEWPKQSILSPPEPFDEERSICLFTTIQQKPPIIPLNRYSSLLDSNAWPDECFGSSSIVVLLRKTDPKISMPLSPPRACCCWKLLDFDFTGRPFQGGSWLSHFHNALPSKSCLLPLHPFLDYFSILRVSGREQNFKLSYSNLHSVCDLSWKSFCDKAHHMYRAFTFLACRTHTPHLLTLLSAHHWLSQHCSLYYSRMHCLSSQHSKAQVSDAGTTFGWVYYPWIHVWEGQCRLCWAILHHVWICP